MALPVVVKMAGWTASGRGRNRRYTRGGWVIVPRSIPRSVGRLQLRWALSRSGRLQAHLYDLRDAFAIVERYGRE